jgi:hypothetical protein
VQVTADDIVERDETVRAQIRNVDANGLEVTLGTSTTTGTIVNDDQAMFELVGYSVSEGSAQKQVDFQIRLSNKVDAPITVRFSTIAGGTATAGLDYTGMNDELVTFSANDITPKTVHVLVNNDDVVELTETLQAGISRLDANGMNVAIATTSAAATIFDDDTATVSIDDLSRAEGDASTTFTFTITMSKPVDAPVLMTVDTANGTATTSLGVGGLDYQAINRRVETFAPGSTSRTVSVTVNGDKTVEAMENFFLNLSGLLSSGRAVSFAKSQGVGSIGNDDSAALTIKDVRQSESNGATTFTFTVNSTAAIDVPISLAANTTDGTARALIGGVGGNDYQALNNQAITLAAGSRSQTFSVTVNGDSVVEGDENFLVNLSNLFANNRPVSLVRSQAVGTILNDDTATLSISDVRQVETNGTTTFVFTLSSTAPIDKAISATASTSDGLARAATSGIGGGDYQTVIGQTVSLAAGSQAQTVSVTVNGDKVVEGDETFFVNLFNLLASGRAVSFGRSQAVGTILNDDTATLSINDVRQIETNGATTFVFTLSSTAPIDTAISLKANTSGGTAIAAQVGVGGADYQRLVNQPINFAAGSLSQTINVQVIGDTLAEFDDTFNVGLSSLLTNNRAVSLLRSQGVGTIVNDDWGANLLEDGTLLVIGTAYDDNIDIHIKDPKNGADQSRVQIKTKGVSGEINTGWVASPTGVIAKVVAYGLDGKDSIKVDDQQPGVSAWLYGGNGDDKLDAGKGSAVLVGGDGNDELKGADGLNVLIGGKGSDKLSAGKGNAILIGGYTIYDEPNASNFAALDAVMASLASGGASAPSQLNSTTVHDDGFVDELNGGEGLDWFFANLVQDDIKKKKSSDRLVNTAGW